MTYITKIIKIWKNSFIKFIEKTPPTGKAVVCLDNQIKKDFE